MGAFFDGLGGAINLAYAIFCAIMIVFILLVVRWAAPRMWRRGREARLEDKSRTVVHGVLVDEGTGSMTEVVQKHRNLVVAGAPFNPDDAVLHRESGEFAGPFVVYRFLVDGQERVGADRVAAPLGTKIGDRFDVSYDPDDPDDNRGTSEHKSNFRWWAGLCILVVGILLACAAAFGIMGWESFQRFQGVR